MKGDAIMQIYERVYKYMIEKGINPKIIANKCDISSTSFNAMMKGRRKMYAEDLRAICYALEVSPEEFIEYKEKNRIQET